MGPAVKRDCGGEQGTFANRLGWLAAALFVLVLVNPVHADDIDPAEPAAAAPAEAAAAPTAEAKPVDPKTQKILNDLEEFCKKWMGFLLIRERDNRAAIDWLPGPTGVSGKFVGYSSDYDCELRDATKPNAVPVATITYREYIYQQEGDSKDVATGTAPRVMEATEVTEIFRYSQGKWVY
jgi:hypothetical protein